MNEICWPTQDAIAGVDEVGRGCLFGPVVAAAVILSPEQARRLWEEGLQDSKRLKPEERLRLNHLIRATTPCWGLGLASVAEIDRINILQGALLAMKRAVYKLNPLPQVCWIDGNKTIPHFEIPQHTLIKGDQMAPAIAAASVIAKVWRDQLMERLEGVYPGYGIAQHKGYGTPQHRLALAKLGRSRQHRRSFRIGEKKT